MSDPTNKGSLDLDLINQLSKNDLLNIIQNVLIKKEDLQTDKHPIPSNNNNNNNNNNNETNFAKDTEDTKNTKDIKDTKDNTTEIKPIEFPIDNIITKLNQIQNLINLLGNNNKNHSRLTNFNNSLISLIDSFSNDLLSEKETLNNEFLKSLETISKIFSITSRFKPIEDINESVLNPIIKNIIDNYFSNSFKNLDYYCNDKLSMFDLNNLIEDDLIRLIPILSQQLLSFNKQLKKFYSLYDLIDDYNDLIDINFLNKLPTKSDLNLFNKINEATDIKLILQTNFNQINPNLISKLDSEILNLNNFINLKCNDLRNLIKKTINLNHELFKEDDNLNYLKLPNFIDNNNLLISNIGIKLKNFNYYNDLFNKFNKIKIERENILNNYLNKVENLWLILHSNLNSDEIQVFLKENKNLYLDSFKNFENLIINLEKEKIENLKKIIYLSREKIKSYWDILTYDEDSRLKFKEFYINDENEFNDSLLNAHTIELNNLRNEIEALKPLLNLISNLDNLIDEKKKLDESSKNPSRLLKRNSFNILKEEERIRNKVNKQFPILFNDLRDKIIEFEDINNRLFKLDGIRYLDKLEEIENFFTHSKRTKRFSSDKNNSNPSSIKRNFNTNSNSKLNSKSNISSIKRSCKKIQTPSHSIIRKRNPDQMKNPFLSRDPTPLTSRTFSPIVINSSSSINTSTSSPKSITTQVLSNQPIVLRGRSPVKTLDLNASKIISISNPSPSPKIKKKLPLSTSILNNNNNIPINYSQKNKCNSTPVEELSDSFLEYPENEITNLNKLNNQENNKYNKENESPVNLSKITITFKNQQQTINNFNLSLDSETF